MSINPTLTQSLADVASHSTARCPLCQSHELSDFLTLDGLTVHIGRLWPDRAAGLSAPRASVTLAWCHGCGFVFNRAYDAGKIAYEPGYEYSLHHSPSHRAFLSTTVDRLVADYDLHGKHIVEIGCGSGYFLQLLCERGANRGWGFDPAIARPTTIAAGDGEVTLVRDLYDDRYAHLPCDLVCCRSMFELVSQPIALLRNLRRVIGKRSGARLYLDIPNTSYIFRHRALWSVFYEQCNYFTQATLIAALQRSGFDVLKSGECLGDGFYLYVDAAPAPARANFDAPLDHPLPPELLKLAPHHARQLALWDERFDKWHREGQRVVAWGSGGRGINFLNLTGAARLIDHVVDINPVRQGGFISGSGQQVISPETLIELRPDVIVITNNLYGEEIRRHVATLGLACEFFEI